MPNEIAADLLKVGLDDARARHAAVVNLILFTDTQALGLLRLYVPLGIATGSGAVAAFASNPAIPKAAGFALIAVTALLIAACWLCFEAMKTAAINLPGRGAEFWQWSVEVGATPAFVAYMANLREKQAANTALNARTARALAWSKSCAIAAPPTAIIVGALAIWAGF